MTAMKDIKESSFFNGRTILIFNIFEMERSGQGKYLAVIIGEVKSSSRELYPLTKNYPMPLLPIGTKKLIVYQLESLAPLDSIAEIVVITGQVDSSLKNYIQSSFKPQHREYPHNIEYFSVKDITNTFSAFKQLLKNNNQNYQGFIVLHGDTIVGVPITNFVSFHQQKSSDLTLLLKAKRELGEQEKKLPQGQIETELDNVLLGQKGEVLFVDMADQLENNGVKIDPSIYSQTRKAAFRRVLDSKVYLMSSRVGRMVVQLSSQQIHQIKPELIQLLVENQTNKQMLNITSEFSEEDLKPLRIFANFYQQQVFIRKISTKKIYETINFQSLLRGSKQKEILLPTSYSDTTELKSGHSCLVGDNVTIANGAKLRRSILGAECIIGKNVEIFNSILLNGVEIKDNCKINECVLGAGTVVGENAQVKGTYSEGGCRIADSLKVEGQTLIRTQ